jgi:cytochrome bd-type quinol oxidase subunit 2
MRKKKRSIFELLISLLTFGTVFFLINNFPPNYQIAINNFKLPILPLFFILIFAGIFLFFEVILANKRRGILIALFSVSYLLLRFFGLTSLLFPALLLILFAGIEKFFVKRL